MCLIQFKKSLTFRLLSKLQILNGPTCSTYKQQNSRFTRRKYNVPLLGYGEKRGDRTRQQNGWKYIR